MLDQDKHELFGAPDISMLENRLTMWQDNKAIAERHLTRANEEIAKTQQELRAARILLSGEVEISPVSRD